MLRELPSAMHTGVFGPSQRNESIQTDQIIIPPPKKGELQMRFTCNFGFPDEPNELRVHKSQT